LLAYRELDDALGLSGMAEEALADVRTGRTAGMLSRNAAAIRFGRLAGHREVNDTERLRLDRVIHNAYRSTLLVRKRHRSSP